MQAYVRLSILFFILGSLLFLSCDSSLDGNRIENQPPRTFLTVDNIAIDEDNRLSSRVDISWWGDDPDGYIVGYEYAIGDTSEGSWNFTTRTDSTFILPISPGEETDDVLFAVRAIDNDDAVDPVGASVVFPLRNSPPTTELNPLELPPDTTYGVFSFGWNISDPDGRATILRTEIAVNDTTNGWTEIPIESEDQENFFVTFVVNDHSQTTADAELYLGRSFRATGETLNGFQLNSDNTFYVRTVDRALAQSEVEETTWHLKQQTSNILVLNDYAGSVSQTKLNFHVAELQNLGFDVDVIDISGGTGLQGGIVPLSSAFPRVIQPTLSVALSEWDHIYLFSSGLTRNINYAQEILDRFFSEDGTFFASIPITRDQSRLDDPLFNFLPISSFVEVSGSQIGFRIQNNAEIFSMAGGPNLRNTGGINTEIWPFETAGGGTSLYEADLLLRLTGGRLQEYEGTSTISAMNSEGNFVFFGMDLTEVEVAADDENNGDNETDGLRELLEELLINRLGFTQQ